MNTTEIESTANALMAPGKGLLAMDESNPTCNRRFAVIDVPQTREARRDYRRLIATAPGLGKFISGAILYDETINETLKDGEPFASALNNAGIIPGIKVDRGAVDMAGFPNEKITEGLDGLVDRVQRFARMGARFAKWRAVISITSDGPSQGCIDAMSYALARYAAVCQSAGLVPIVEPEVLVNGTHDLERCAAVTERMLRAVFCQLISQRVLLEGMILKPNMVTPGTRADQQSTVEQVADATVRTLLRSVPAAVAGVAFLSGGQPATLATERLNAMNLRLGRRAPWPLTFSFSRALQQQALETWAGQEANVEGAQKVLVHRARCNAAASLGKYNSATEHEPPMSCTEATSGLQHS